MLQTDKGTRPTIIFSCNVKTLLIVLMYFILHFSLFFLWIIHVVMIDSDMVYEQGLGGKQCIMHQSKIDKVEGYLGKYNSILKPGDTHHMVFSSSDSGPFI